MAATKQPIIADRYILQKKLGAGQFGVVYSVKDTRLNRDSAMKILKPEALSTPSACKRFLGEAALLAQVTHSNVVRLLDFGEHEKKYFIVTDLVEGGTLEHHLKKDRVMAPRRAVKLVIQLLSALDHVYANHKLLHRDVKPANIMIASGDRLFLMDFGLAVCVDQETQTRTTKDGSMVGTPAYMTPEQARGHVKLICHQSDLFSAGVILYELLSGRRPFTGTDLMGLLYQIVNEEPPPLTEVAPNVDPYLEAVCQKALAKRIEDRYQTGQEFIEDLEAWIENRTGTDGRSLPNVGVPNTPTGTYPDQTATVSIGTPGGNSNKLIIIICAVLALLILIGGVIVLKSLRKPNTLPAPPRSQSHQPELIAFRDGVPVTFSDTPAG